MAMIIVEASSLCSPLGTSGSPAMSGIPNTSVGGGKDGSTPERYAFFRLDTISIRYLAFLFDTMRYRYDIVASEKTFFLRNFRRIFRNFGEFSEFSENFLNFRNFRRIFGEFSDFRRIFGEFSAEKHKNTSISRYSIL